MKKPITEKSHAIAAPLAAKDPTVLQAIEAEGWLRVALQNVGRNTNITHDFLIYDQKEPLNSFGIDNEPDDLIKNTTHLASEIVKTEINNIGDLPIVKAMRIAKPSVTISLDTEYYIDEKKKRRVLSWQLCFIKKDLLYKVLVFPASEKLLDFRKILSFLIEYYDLNEPYVQKDGLKYKDFRRWEVPEKQLNGRIKKAVCSTFDEAVSRCCDMELKEKLLSVGDKHEAKYGAKAKYRIGYYYDCTEINKHTIPVTLCMHFSPADLTTFGINDDNGVDILKHCSSIQGGIVTLRPVSMWIKNDQGYGRFYPITLSIRDTICFAPDGKKSLDSIGETIGMRKLELPKGYTKDRMQDFLTREPELFASYASRDAVITLLYASRLWGVNRRMPVTISSAACKAAVPLFKEYFGISQDDSEKFNWIYRGLEKREKGKVMTSNGLKQDTAFEPVNADAAIIQDFATKSYHGGFNGSSKNGYFYCYTFDYDLKGAYPTAMACVYDIDWSDPIQAEYKNTRVKLDMFDTPVDPVFGYVRIRFPAGVRYPSIPINVNGSIIFPLSSVNDYVYAAGPDIYTALKLGAEVNAQRLIKLRKLKRPDGSYSHSLREVVRSFVKNRDIAQLIFGEESLEQQLIKLADNSLYGKVSQGVIQKKTWSVPNKQMVEIGPSLMTSPYHAAMITSIVRCILISAMNEIEKNKYHTYSVTTDGFITDAPFDVIKDLDLFGFRSLIEKARLDLTDCKDMWKIKHEQQELLNITTRGNVGFNWTTLDDGVFDNEIYITDDQGVLAHNGYKSPKDLTSVEDRIEFAKAVLGRTGRVPCKVLVKTSFRKLSSMDAREDFLMNEETKYLSMDFDMKRKPVKESIYTERPTIDDQTYEIACFETEPFETVEEYKLYKAKAQNSQVLKTESDWRAFFERVNRTQTGQKRVAITDYNKRVLQSCVMAVVQGVEITALGGRAEIDILLHKSVSVAQKLNWINMFNKGKTRFTKNDWRNARRKDRLQQMLPEQEFLPLLLEMLEAATDQNS